VNELSWVDVEVTSDVCCVVNFSNVESRCNVVGETEAAVDDVVCTLTDAMTRHRTQTVEPE